MRQIEEKIYLAHYDSSTGKAISRPLQQKYRKRDISPVTIEVQGKR
jgi:hypothetical protein